MLNRLKSAKSVECTTINQTEDVDHITRTLEKDEVLKPKFVLDFAQTTRSQPDDSAMKVVLFSKYHEELNPPHTATAGARQKARSQEMLPFNNFKSSVLISNSQTSMPEAEVPVATPAVEPKFSPEKLIEQLVLPARRQITPKNFICNMQQATKRPMTCLEDSPSPHRRDFDQLIPKLTSKFRALKTKSPARPKAPEPHKTTTNLGLFNQQVVSVSYKDEKLQPSAARV